MITIVSKRLKCPEKIDILEKLEELEGLKLVMQESNKIIILINENKKLTKAQKH